MPKIKLSKSVVDNLAPPPQGTPQLDYWDTDLKGFGVTVGARAKTYCVMRRVNGRNIRVSIDRHNVITFKDAKDRAAQLLVEMKQGINPNLKKRVATERNITLKEAYEKYAETRSIKASTKSKDLSLLNCHLSSWLNKPIADVTKDMVSKRHGDLSKTAGDHTANNVFRMFRRVYNCINAHLDDALPQNPVARLSATKQWAKVGRRQTIIADCDLPEWYRAVRAIDNPFMRNYLLLLLFTGLRKEEGLSLEWRNVNMADRAFTLPETKNGKSHTMPMSNYLLDLFTELQTIKQNGYVFPAFVTKGKVEHMTEPKRHVQKVKETSGIEFCLHDLRRVFKTLAQDTVTKAESDRLTNHTSRDAGDGYIILSTEKVREPMQRITDKLLCMTNAWSNFPRT